MGSHAKPGAPRTPDGTGRHAAPGAARTPKGTGRHARPAPMTEPPAPYVEPAPTTAGPNRARHAKPGGPSYVRSARIPGKGAPKHAAPVPGGTRRANVVAGTSGRMSNIGKGLATNGKPEGTGPVVPIMVCVFAIVAVAKMRGAKGTEKIDTPRALFGGFLCTFLLMALYKANSKLGTGFAVLILMATLLKYGPSLDGIGTGKRSDVSALHEDVVGFTPGMYSNTPGGLGYSIDVPRSEKEKKNFNNKDLPVLSDVFGKKK